MNSPTVKSFFFISLFWRWQKLFFACGFTIEIVLTNGKVVGVGAPLLLLPERGRVQLERIRSRNSVARQLLKFFLVQVTIGLPSSSQELKIVVEIQFDSTCMCSEISSWLLPCKDNMKPNLRWMLKGSS